MKQRFHKRGRNARPRHHRCAGANTNGVALHAISLSPARKRTAGRIVLPGRTGGNVALNAGGAGAGPGAGPGLSLILVLLEGVAEDVKRFMVQHKTENVDVDSRGRKVRARVVGAGR